MQKQFHDVTIYPFNHIMYVLMPTALLASTFIKTFISNHDNSNGSFSNPPTYNNQIDNIVCIRPHEVVMKLSQNFMFETKVTKGCGLSKYTINTDTHTIEKEGWIMDRLM